jgi:hypothetical protein
MPGFRVGCRTDLPIFFATATPSVGTPRKVIITRIEFLFFEVTYWDTVSMVDTD